MLTYMPAARLQQSDDVLRLRYGYHLFGRETGEVVGEVEGQCREQPGV